MRARGPVGHYVAHNAVTRIPRTFIYLDTEARRHVRTGGETHTFRCAVAAVDRRIHGRDGWRDRITRRYLDPGALWTDIDRWCGRRARTVLVAHNLGYDLRIGDAFSRLSTLGWSLKAIRLDGGQCWARWSCGDRTLVMVDSLSWVNVALEKLGELVEIPKLALPGWDDSDDAWLARCERDVEILAEVWRRLMRWVDTEDLGNWKPTGAGQAWAAYRHRFMDHPLLVHEDDDARAAERAAAHTGRCEAWRHGTLRGGPFTEWDLTAAYATIGATHDVPTKLIGEISRPTLAQVQKAALKTAVLAEVEVVTDAPTVPLRSGGRIVWPIGSFATTLWDCEIEQAIAAGARVEVRRAWWYRKQPALRRFCRWILDALEARDGQLDPVVRVACKHWSRALIGRMAATWTETESYGRSPISDVQLGTVIDLSADERFGLLQVGHDLIRLNGKVENPDAMVAVMSFVMAQCRVELWRCMSLAGFDHVAYCDTDSLIVDPAGSRRLSEAAVPGLRVKGVWRSARILGPRQIDLQGRLRAAGVPRGAVPVGDDVYEGDVWAGVGESLRSGSPDRVAITRRRFWIRGVDARRVHLPGGRTDPVRVDELGQLDKRDAAGF